MAEKTKKVRSVNSELFKLDGKPSLGAAFPQALQHILAMLVGNITPPILLSQRMGLPEEDKVLLIQAAMIIGGITTLLQLYPLFKKKNFLSFGMGLPSVMGVAFAYMPILMTIGMAPDDPMRGLSNIFGAQLVAGFVSIFIGMFMSKIRKFFPPIVSGTVVLAIGLSLYNTAIKNMAGGNTVGDKIGGAGYWIIGISVLVVTLACSLLGKGTIKISGMLIGLAFGYIFALIVGGRFALWPDPLVDFSKITDAQIFALPKFFKWGITFDPAAILAMILMYIVQAVQTIGDVSSTTIGGFGREATDQELGGAIRGQGLCGMLGACIGGLPTDPYSQNVGLIVTTKVVAKRVFLIVGGIMLVAGFFPVFGGAMTTIPDPVLGGATLTVFASITMSGIQLITQQPLNYRNKMIVGVSLALGVGVQALGSEVLSKAPQLVQDLFGTSPIILAFLVAFLLNLIIPKDETPED